MITSALIVCIDMAFQQLLKLHINPLQNVILWISLFHLSLCFNQSLWRSEIEFHELQVSVQRYVTVDKWCAEYWCLVF